MDWELSLFNVALVIAFYESLHGYLYFRSREVRREGKVSIRVLDRGERNALTLNSIFFRNAVVFLSEEVDEGILRHEEGHLNQFNYVYALLVATGALLPLSSLVAIPAIVLGKLLLWKMERDADLHAYHRYNIKYESGGTRPARRAARLLAWLLDSHPPDYIRKEEKYYDKKTSILSLFVGDLAK